MTAGRGAAVDRRRALAWVVRVGAYVYAVFYTGLDTLAGIGAGLVVVAQPAGGPVVFDLFRVGDQLAAVGVTGFLVASLLEWRPGAPA